MTALFYTSFNRAMFHNLRDGDNLHPSLRRPWIYYRFRLWRKYVWSSILRQTDRDWMYVVCCHGDARKITQPLFSSIKDSRLVVTHSLLEEQAFIKSVKGDEVYLIRLDSDDMYHPFTLAELRKAPVHEWYYWQNGYIYIMRPDTVVSENGKMWLYDCIKCGPFFAHRYTPRNWRKKTGITEPSHGKILQHNPYRMPDGRFVVGINDHNTSTRIRSRNTGEKLFGDRKWKILEEFGIR